MNSDAKQHVFGRIVIAAREAKNISRYALARRAGFSDNRMYRIENGWNEPKIGTIITIAQALEMKPWELFKQVCEALVEEEAKAEKAQEE